MECELSAESDAIKSIHHYNKQQLPLLSVSRPKQLLSAAEEPPPSGSVRPRPLRTSSAASVPFGWEEEPGKPRRPPACSTAALPQLALPTQKCLHLPPRLHKIDHYSSRLITTKSTSPTTTVFDGPYYNNVGKTLSTSFRIFSGSSKRQDSFDSRRFTNYNYKTPPPPPEIGTLFFIDNKSERGGGQKGRGLFGSWGQKHNAITKISKASTKQEDFASSEGSFVFSSSMNSSPSDINESNSNGTTTTPTTDTTSKVKANITRSGSFSNLSHASSRFWTAMCQGLKQTMIPWKTSKSKRGLVEDDIIIIM